MHHLDPLVAIVSRIYDVPVELIMSQCRRHTVARARFVAMEIASRTTKLTQFDIGSYFYREPCTVSHAATVIREALIESPGMRHVHARIMEEWLACADCFAILNDEYFTDEKGEAA
jgi:chromosomal replication initiation ATPase DnaA